jgi:hypothetical protein
MNNDNEITVVKFAISKNRRDESTVFLYHNIHKFTFTSPDGKSHNRIGRILLDRRWHSSELDV